MDAPEQQCRAIEQSRGSSGRSGHPWSRPTSSGSDAVSRRMTSAADDSPSGAVSRPVLLCACGIPLCKKTSHSDRNPNREYYVCQKSGTTDKYVCKTWIWVDLVCHYVEQMVKFKTRDSVLEKLEQELLAVENELGQKIKLLNCRERDLVEQRRVHQNEIAVLLSQIEGLQSQISPMKKSDSKFRKARLLMLLLVAMCWLLSPCSFLIALFATMIAVFMFLV